MSKTMAAQRNTRATPCSTLAPVGDLDQRYELRCLDGEGKQRTVCFSDRWPWAAIRGVRAHPSWHSPSVFDREGGYFRHFDRVHEDTTPCPPRK